MVRSIAASLSRSLGSGSQGCKYRQQLLQITRFGEVERLAIGIELLC
jgi:hypothetical protein